MNHGATSVALVPRANSNGFIVGPATNITSTAFYRNEEAPPNRVDSLPSGQLAEETTLFAAKTEDRELDSLRRQVQDFTLSEASVKTRDYEARVALQQALAEVDGRAEDAAQADWARSERLGALVHVRTQSCDCKAGSWPCCHNSYFISVRWQVMWNGDSECSGCKLGLCWIHCQPS